MSYKDYIKNQKNRIKQLLIECNGNLLDVQMKIYVETRIDVDIEDLRILLDSKSFKPIKNIISYNKIRLIEDKLFEMAMENNIKAIELFLKRQDEKSKDRKSSDININLSLPDNLKEDM